MVASGIPVNDTCVSTFNELKAGHGPRYMIMQIVNKEVTVTAKGEHTATYADFLEKIKTDDACYAFYDFDWEVEGAKRNKILFISFNPDTGSVRNKMTYASTKESVRNIAEGGFVEVQATDAEGISFDSVLAKAKAATH